MAPNEITPLPEEAAAELLGNLKHARRIVNNLAEWAIYDRGVDASWFVHLPEVWNPNYWNVFSSSTPDFAHTGRTDPTTGLVAVVESAPLRTIVHEGIHRAAALGRKRLHVASPYTAALGLLDGTSYADYPNAPSLVRHYLVEGITEWNLRKAATLTDDFEDTQARYIEQVDMIENIRKNSALAPGQTEALFVQVGLTGDFMKLVRAIDCSTALATALDERKAVEAFIAES